MTHTDDSRAFVRRIAEQPDDDTTRLVYADYLDDHGLDPARAELIRVQVDAARNQSAFACSEFMYSCGESGFYGTYLACDNCKRGFASISRERELIRDNEARWRAGPKCKGCRGRKQVITESVYGYRPEYGPCPACHGTGDAGGLMARHDKPIITGGSDCGWRCPVTFRGGFIHRVTVPTMDVLVSRWEPGGPRTCPSPLFCAILTATDDHPERALIREVLPADREPAPSLPGRFAWWDEGQGAVSASALPTFLYREIRGTDASLPVRSFATREAAISALGRAIVTWARKSV